MDIKHRFRILLDSMPDIICFKDGQGRWIEANKSDLELFDLVGVDYRGKTDRDLIQYSPHFKEAFLKCEKTDQAAWQNAGPSRSDEIIVKPDGTEKIYDVIKLPLFNNDGTRKGLLVVGRDVTEKRRLEKRLNEVSKLKDIILKLSVDFINVPVNNLKKRINDSLKIIGEFLRADRAYIFEIDFKKGFMSKTYEWRAKDVKTRRDKIQNIPIGHYSSLLGRHKKGEVIKVLPNEPVKDKILRKILSLHNINSLISLPIMSPANECIGLVAIEGIKNEEIVSDEYIDALYVLAEILANILMKRNLCEKLEKEGKKFKNFVERLPVGLYQSIPDADGKFLMVNKALINMFGYKNAEEMLNLPVVNLYPKEKDRILFCQKLFQNGVVKNSEWKLKKKDGSDIWVSVTASVQKDESTGLQYFEGCVFDITKRKKAEQEQNRLQLQLNQAQRLESIGRLAAGIAHDLNNMLVPILGYSEILLTRFGPDHPDFILVQKIIKAGEKARDITPSIKHTT